MTVRYTDGPASSDCSSKTDNWTPLDGTTNITDSSGENGETTRFSTAASSGNYCILQGDVLTVCLLYTSDAADE